MWVPAATASDEEVKEYVILDALLSLKKKIT